jgi:hypothetical protein
MIATDALIKKLIPAFIKNHIICGNFFLATDALIKENKECLHRKSNNQWQLFSATDSPVIEIK